MEGVLGRRLGMIVWMAKMSRNAMATREGVDGLAVRDAAVGDMAVVSDRDG